MKLMSIAAMVVGAVGIIYGVWAMLTASTTSNALFGIVVGGGALVSGLIAHRWRTPPTTEELDALDPDVRDRAATTSEPDPDNDTQPDPDPEPSPATSPQP